jgi:multidrug resistance efflux pump
VKSAEFTLKSARQRVEYQEEELRQLEKMYEADDLTEETEAIVLTRARNALESARFSFENAKAAHAQQIQFGLPRARATAIETARQAAMQNRSTTSAIPAALAKKRIELQKAKTERAQLEKKWDGLLRDRAAMNVRAPIDGIVYYGQCVRGKWAGGAAIAKKLRPGGAIAANEIIMTVVAPRRLAIRAAVPEKYIGRIQVETQGTITPTGFPKVSIPVKVTKIASIPSEDGSFAAVITIASKRNTGSLMPGMTGKLKFEPGKPE